MLLRQRAQGEAMLVLEDRLGEEGRRRRGMDVWEAWAPGEQDGRAGRARVEV